MAPGSKESVGQGGDTTIRNVRLVLSADRDTFDAAAATVASSPLGVTVSTAPFVWPQSAQKTPARASEFHWHNRAVKPRSMRKSGRPTVECGQFWCRERNRVLVTKAVTTTPDHTINNPISRGCALILGGAPSIGPRVSRRGNPPRNTLSRPLRRPRPCDRCRAESIR